MPDVFISYSRRDGDFVSRLTAALDGRGKQVWLDTESIADAEVFPQAIRRAIESSDAFVFVISPEAVRSAYCEQEVAYAGELGKRIVPVLRERVPDPEIPAEIRERNWIPFEDDAEFGSSLDRIVQALDTDLEHRREHTRWLTKAIEWDAADRDRSFLLRGSELTGAEAWLAESERGADPAPTTRQREYLLASRQVHERRQRILVTASLAIAAVAVALLVFALISRGQAVTAKTTANSRALAAESQNDLAVDPGASILLAERALRASSTPEAQLALRQALDASPFVRELPARPGLTCLVGEGATVAYRPDGAEIAEGFCNDGVLLVDAGSGAVTHRISGRADVTAIAYSGDGKTLAIADARGVALYEDRLSKVVRVLHAPERSLNSAPMNAASSLAFSADGTKLVAAAPGGVVLYDVASGRARVFGAHDVPVQTQFGSVVFTPDARFLVASTWQSFVSVFDATSGARVRELPLVGGPFGCGPAAVAMTSTGTLLIATNPCDGGVTVSAWSTRTWTLQYTLARFGTITVSSLAASRDGTRLAIGEANGVASVWSLATRAQLVPIVGVAAAVTQIAFDPNGDELATASNDGVPRVWRAHGPARLEIDTGAPQVWSIGLGANQLVASIRTRDAIVVESFDLRRGTLQDRFTVEHSPLDGAWVSPDGKLVAALDPVKTGDLTIWDVATHHLVRRIAGMQGNSGAWSADDRKVAIGSGDPVMSPALVDVATGKQTVLAGLNPRCYSLDAAAPTFAAHGDRVAWSTFCGQVIVWNTKSGARVTTFDDKTQVSALALDPTGTHLAVAAWNGDLTVVALDSTKTALHVVADAQSIAEVAYSSDGRWIVTTSQDGTARMWDARSGRLLRVDEHPSAVEAVTFGPGARMIATADAQGVVRVWDACSACGDTKALLALAAQHVVHHPTPLESAASG